MQAWLWWTSKAGSCQRHLATRTVSAAGSSVHRSGPGQRSPASNFFYKKIKLYFIKKSPDLDKQHLQRIHVDAIVVRLLVGALVAVAVPLRLVLPIDALVPAAPISDSICAHTDCPLPT